MRNNPSEVLRASVGSRAIFQSTQWNVVLTAGRASPEDAFAALEDLCRLYWYPIYAFVRRRGHSPQDAQDLTQGFFADLLQSEWLDGLGPEHGRFRTFLLRCLTNYLANSWNRERGPRRWPSGGIVRLEITDAEDRYAHEPIDDTTPEKLFHRRWVANLVDQAKARLRIECAQGDKLRQFDALEPHLGDRLESGTVSEIAATLGMSEGALRVALHRLRRRFAEFLREGVTQTLKDPNDAQAEIRALFGAWT